MNAPPEWSSVGWLPYTSECWEDALSILAHDPHMPFPIEPCFQIRCQPFQSARLLLRLDVAPQWSVPQSCLLRSHHHDVQSWISIACHLLINAEDVSSRKWRWKIFGPFKTLSKTLSTICPDIIALWAEGEISGPSWAWRAGRERRNSSSKSREVYIRATFVSSTTCLETCILLTCISMNYVLCNFSPSPDLTIVYRILHRSIRNKSIYKDWLLLAKPEGSYWCLRIVCRIPRL